MKIWLKVACCVLKIKVYHQVKYLKQYLKDSINCWLRSLGKERIETVADGHFLLYTWTRGFNITKRSV